MNSVQAPEKPSSKRRSIAGVWLVALLLAGPTIIHDSVVPREDEWSTQAGISMIRGYQLFVSPYLGSHCRFTPTCSRYGLESVRKHGLIVGSAKTAWRIIRCNPFTKKGTVDLP
jgi:uncharacterized protein